MGESKQVAWKEFGTRVAALRKSITKYGLLSDILEDVEDNLQKLERQAHQENPNPKIIRSRLKSCQELLAELGNDVAKEAIDRLRRELNGLGAPALLGSDDKKTIAAEGEKAAGEFTGRDRTSQALGGGNSLS